MVAKLPSSTLDSTNVDGTEVTGCHNMGEFIMLVLFEQLGLYGDDYLGEFVLGYWVRAVDWS